MFVAFNVMLVWIALLCCVGLFWVITKKTSFYVHVTWRIIGIVSLQIFRSIDSGSVKGFPLTAEEVTKQVDGISRLVFLSYADLTLVINPSHPGFFLGLFMFLSMSYFTFCSLKVWLLTRPSRLFGTGLNAVSRLGKECSHRH